jgi:glycosyltransferase involved in cell wall biosynthesis
MKVFVLAYGNGEAASTVYRFRALQPFWAAQGHELKVGSLQALAPDVEDSLAGVDVLVNQKALVPPAFGRRLLGLQRPVFFDFDDAIWTRPGQPYSWWTQWRVNRRVRFWLIRAEGILVANQQLAAYARRYSNRVHLVPMALDLEVWRPRPRGEAARVRIGWAGSPGNLRHLEALRGVLARVIAAQPQSEVAVFCGRRPAFDFPFEFQPYSPGKEVAFVSGLDIGLLPLQEEPYSLCKSPIKALQYLSCAVPVVGHVRGATAEILNPANSLAVESEADWHGALERLITSPAERAALGRAGREHIERQYDVRTVSRQLIGILSAAV